MSSQLEEWEWLTKAITGNKRGGKQRIPEKSTPPQSPEKPRKNAIRRKQQRGQRCASQLRCKSSCIRIGLGIHIRIRLPICNISHLQSAADRKSGGQQLGGGFEQLWRRDLRPLRWRWRPLRLPDGLRCQRERAVERPLRTAPATPALLCGRARPERWTDHMRPLLLGDAHQEHLHVWGDDRWVWKNMQNKQGS